MQTACKFRGYLEKTSRRTRCIQQEHKGVLVECSKTEEWCCDKNYHSSDYYAEFLLSYETTLNASGRNPLFVMVSLLGPFDELHPEIISGASLAIVHVPHTFLERMMCETIDEQGSITQGLG